MRSCTCSRARSRSAARFDRSPVRLRVRASRTRRWADKEREARSTQDGEVRNCDQTVDVAGSTCSVFLYEKEPSSVCLPSAGGRPVMDREDKVRPVRGVVDDVQGTLQAHAQGLGDVSANPGQGRQKKDVMGTTSGQ